MPLFGYLCEKCKKESEILVRGSETPKCPHCGSERLVKQAAAFAAMASHGKPSGPAGCDTGSCSRFQSGCCPHAS